MGNRPQNPANPDPDPREQPVKTDAESENLTERELRAISGGYVVKGSPPPPPPKPPIGWNPQG